MTFRGRTLKAETSSMGATSHVFADLKAGGKYLAAIVANGTANNLTVSTANGRGTETEFIGVGANVPIDLDDKATDITLTTSAAADVHLRRVVDNGT